MFEVVYIKNTRIVRAKRRGTSFCHLSLIKIKGNNDFYQKISLKNGRLYVDEVNIKNGFLLREYKLLTYFTDGFLRYIYITPLVKKMQKNSHL